MAFELPDRWIWDSWFYNHEGETHMFFLNAPKSLGNPDHRHFYATIGHAISRDMKNWFYQGTVLQASDGPAWDDLATWTGSVIQCPTGGWYMFYTGISRAERGHVQRIGMAYSETLHTWEKLREGPAVEADPRYYEKLDMEGCVDEACRDPFVFRDPDGEGWHMYFTASGHRSSRSENGVIGHARSADLLSWEVLPPIFSGRVASELEVPEVFEMGGRWYLLYSTWARNIAETYQTRANVKVNSGTHYMVSDTGPLGPWVPVEGPGLLVDPDDRYYVARRVPGVQSHSALIAFNNSDGFGHFPGTLTDPIDFHAAPDGTLQLCSKLTY